MTATEPKPTTSRPPNVVRFGTDWTDDLNMQEMSKLPVEKSKNEFKVSKPSCSVCKLSAVNVNESHWCGHVTHAKIWINRDDVEKLTRDGRGYKPFPKIVHHGRDVTQGEIIVRMPVVNYAIDSNKCTWKKWQDVKKKDVKKKDEKKEDEKESITFRHHQYKEHVFVHNTGEEQWCIVGVSVTQCNFAADDAVGKTKMLEFSNIDWQMSKRMQTSNLLQEGRTARFNNNAKEFTHEGNPRFFKAKTPFGPGENGHIELVPVHNDVVTHGVSMHCLRIIIRRLVDGWEDLDNIHAYFDVIIPVVTVHFIPCPIYRDIVPYFTTTDDKAPIEAIVGGVYSAFKPIDGYWTASGRDVKEVRKGSTISLDIPYYSSEVHLLGVKIVPVTMWQWCFEIVPRPMPDEDSKHRFRIHVLDATFPNEASIIIEVSYRHVSADQTDGEAIDRYYIEMRFRRMESIARAVFDELPESFQRQINAYPLMTRRNIAGFPKPSTHSEGIAESMADDKEAKQDILKDRYGAHEMKEDDALLLMCLLATKNECDTVVDVITRKTNWRSFGLKLAELKTFMEDSASTNDPAVLKKRLLLTKQIEEVSQRDRLSQLTREATFTFEPEEPSPANMEGAIGRLSVDRKVFNDWAFFGGVKVLLSRSIDEKEMKDFEDDFENNQYNYDDVQKREGPRHYFRALVESMDKTKIYFRVGMDNFVLPSRLKGGETFPFLLEVEGIRKMFAHYYRALDVLSPEAIQQYLIQLSDDAMMKADVKATSMPVKIAGGKTFREGLHGKLASFKTPTPYNDRETKDEEGQTIVGSQTQSIERMVYAIGSALTFILIGPPGSGKTWTISWLGRLVASGVLNGRMMQFLLEKSMAREAKMLLDENDFKIGKNRRRRARKLVEDEEEAERRTQDEEGAAYEYEYDDDDEAHEYDQAYEGLPMFPMTTTTPTNVRTPEQIYAADHDGDIRVLAVVESNAAVDKLHKTLVDVGVPVSDTYRIFSKSSKERGGLAPEEMTQCSNLTYVRDEDENIKYDQDGKPRIEVGDIKISGLRKAKIILCTVANVGILHRRRLKIGPIAIVLVDEANQVQETHLVVILAAALQHAHTTLGVTLILAGDVKQLKPVTTEFNQARRNGLKAVLLESTAQRFSHDPRYDPIGYPLDAHPSVCSLLTMLHRGHYTLIQHLIKAVYGGLLKCYINEENEATLVPLQYQNVMRNNGGMAIYGEHEKSPKLNALRFVQVDGKEGQRDRQSKYRPFDEKSPDEDEMNPSTVNPREAEAIVLYIRRLLTEYLIRPEKITVVTPYSEQAKLIHEAMVENFDVETANSIKSCTTEVIEGDENDVILLSCVRTDTAAKLGFFADEGRFSTLVSRAKFLMMVFGDLFGLVRKCGIWSGYCEHAMVEGLYQNLEGIRIEPPTEEPHEELIEEAHEERIEEAHEEPIEEAHEEPTVPAPIKARGRGRRLDQPAPPRPGNDQDQPGPSGIGHR